MVIVVVLLKVLMCEADVTNAELSEDNSISAVKVAQFTLAKGGAMGHDILQITDIHLPHSA